MDGANLLHVWGCTSQYDCQSRQTAQLGMSMRDVTATNSCKIAHFQHVLLVLVMLQRQLAVLRG